MIFWILSLLFIYEGSMNLSNSRHRHNTPRTPVSEFSTLSTRRTELTPEMACDVPGTFCVKASGSDCPPDVCPYATISEAEIYARGIPSSTIYVIGSPDATVSHVECVRLPSDAGGPTKETALLIAAFPGHHVTLGCHSPINAFEIRGLWFEVEGFHFVDERPTDFSTDLKHYMIVTQCKGVVLKDLTVNFGNTYHVGGTYGAGVYVSGSELSEDWGSFVIDGVTFLGDANTAVGTHLVTSEDGDAAKTLLIKNMVSRNPKEDSNYNFISSLNSDYPMVIVSSIIRLNCWFRADTKIYGSQIRTSSVARISFSMNLEIVNTIIEHVGNRDSIITSWGSNAVNVTLSHNHVILVNAAPLLNYGVIVVAGSHPKMDLYLANNLFSQENSELEYCFPLIYFQSSPSELSTVLANNVREGALIGCEWVNPELEGVILRNNQDTVIPVKREGTVPWPYFELTEPFSGESTNPVVFYDFHGRVRDTSSPSRGPFEFDQTEPYFECEDGCNPERGYCLDDGVCKCLNMFAEPPHCIDWECDINCVHGSCSSADLCDICDPGWNGDHCSDAICDDCVMGTCDTPGDCVCDDGWTGLSCSIPTCAEGCQGSCSAPDLCDLCASGYQGPSCSEPVCHGECNRLYGYCERPGGCICEEHWLYPYCNENQWGTCNPPNPYDRNKGPLIWEYGLAHENDGENVQMRVALNLTEDSSIDVYLKGGDSEDANCSFSSSKTPNSAYWSHHYDDSMGPDECKEIVEFYSPSVDFFTCPGVSVLMFPEYDIVRGKLVVAISVESYVEMLEEQVLWRFGKNGEAQESLTVKNSLELLDALIVGRNSSKSGHTVKVLFSVPREGDLYENVVISNVGCSTSTTCISCSIIEKEEFFTSEDRNMPFWYEMYGPCVDCRGFSRTTVFGTFTGFNSIEGSSREIDADLTTWMPEVCDGVHVGDISVSQNSNGNEHGLLEAVKLNGSVVATIMPFTDASILGIVIISPDDGTLWRTLVHNGGVTSDGESMDLDTDVECTSEECVFLVTFVFGLDSELEFYSNLYSADGAYVVSITFSVSYLHGRRETKTLELREFLTVGKDVLGRKIDDIEGGKRFPFFVIGIIGVIAAVCVAVCCLVSLLCIGRHLLGRIDGKTVQ